MSEVSKEEKIDIWQVSVILKRQKESNQIDQNNVNY